MGQKGRQTGNEQKRKKNSTIYQRVKNTIEIYQMIGQNDCIITGVSGGADSVCLLFMLRQLQKEYDFSLRVIHVNHMIRGKEAEADQKFVENLCERLRIPCKVVMQDVPRIAKERNWTEEEAGREVRRAAFEEALKEVEQSSGKGKIALAHHRDDNVETFLWNLCRGTGLKGLGGMRPVNGPYIRPLLEISRKEIEDYLQSKEISYCMDSTNLDTVYTRNKIRHHVIPRLEEVNEKASEHTVRTMELLRGYWDYLEEQISGYAKVCIRQTVNGVLVDGGAFAKIPYELQQDVLRACLVAAGIREKELASAHLSQVQELMEKSVGKYVYLPCGQYARKEEEGILLHKKMPQKTVDVQKPEPFDLSKELLHLREGEVRTVTYGSWTLRLCLYHRISWERYREEKSRKRQNPYETPYTNWFDYDIIKRNVMLRTRRPGDYLMIDCDKRQKLKSYFINEKIPSGQREQIPLLAQEDCVIWILGYRRGHSCYITEQTQKILEIEIDGGENNGRND